MIGPDLFAEASIECQPLASRMRPKRIEDIFGQEHLLGKKTNPFDPLSKPVVNIHLFYGGSWCRENHDSQFSGYIL